MALVSANDKKPSLNPFEKDFFKDIKHPEMREKCIATYRRVCDDIKASRSRTPFCLKFIELMAPEVDFDMRRLQNEEEMIKRVYTFLFKGRVKNAQVAEGLISQLGDLTNGDPSPIQRIANNIDAGLEVLEACIGENGWDKESERFKQIVENIKAKDGDETPRFTPEARAVMQLNGLKGQVEDWQKINKNNIRLCKLANVQNGMWFRPDRDTTNAAASVAKQYDHTLGAGGIDLSLFNA